MKIYFSGMGGVGIGPLVEIARDTGHEVLGSDVAESLVTTELRENGIAVEIGQDGSFLRAEHSKEPIDWFVYTAALPDNHPELLVARELGIRMSKRDELLAYILKENNLKLLAISGTHGKTTTTGMMVWLFQSLGLRVSYSVGTTLPFASSGKYTPDSQYFVYECDEYDRNFLQFSPFLSLIASVDYDHPDTYPFEDDYLSAFRQFIAQSDETILWQADADYLGVEADKATILSTPLPAALHGAHNRRNATLVIEAAVKLGLCTEEQALEALASFPGTDRRFEQLADNLYSDYGHHPAEIEATLQMARELSDHVVLVYQPHQNRRQHELVGGYTNQLEQAEHVYWLPTYLTREDPNLPILTPQQLTETVTNKASISFPELSDELWQAIQDHRKAGHLVLCMGAGTIDEWVRRKLA